MSSTPVLPAHYELRHSLGEGGYGEVFEAFDNKLQRSVAVKRLKNLGDPTQSARLVQEAQLAASLQHAAFVKIYALEESGDTYSIVMELVRGQTLRQLMAGGPLDEAQALAIVRQIAEAMRDAHASGLVHGDLKPSNVMLQPSGAIRILDFGLATQADSQATSSLLQADPQGTIAYMAPERLLGHPLRPSSDMYALGVMLYEMLTGARPFAGLSGLALAAAHMQSNSAQWSYPPGMRPALIQLLRAMTTTPVEQRLQSMQQLCEQLDALDLPTPTHSLRRRYAGRPAYRKLLAGGALALLAGGVWFSVPQWPAMTALTAKLQPYSEAAAMQQGLLELSMWDRPGGLDRADALFNAVLSHHPENAAALAALSVTYSLRYGTDHTDDVWLGKARAAAQQALRLNPQLAFSYIAMANVLLQEEQLEPALAMFDRALGLDPENIFALNGRINVLRKSRRFDAALHEAQAALLLHPLERVFADQIGTIHYIQGHYPEAEQAFRQSIRIQPDAVVAYANLSAALASQNRQDEALHVLQQGLQIRPGAWLYGNLGNILFLRGDYAGAVTAFEAAVAPDKGNPADYLGWANLADTLLWIPGREPQARQAYQRAITLLTPRLQRAPNDVTMISRMALYAAHTGAREQCENLLRHALTLAPKAADLQFRAGLAYELLGQRSQALTAIRQAAQLGYPTRFIDAAPELVALRRDPAYQPQ